MYMPFQKPVHGLMPAPAREQAQPKRLFLTPFKQKLKVIAVRLKGIPLAPKIINVSADLLRETIKISVDYPAPLLIATAHLTKGKLMGLAIGAVPTGKLFKKTGHALARKEWCIKITGAVPHVMKSTDIHGMPHYKDAVATRISVFMKMRQENASIASGPPKNGMREQNHVFRYAQGKRIR